MRAAHNNPARRLRPPKSTFTVRGAHSCWPFQLSALITLVILVALASGGALHQPAGNITLAENDSTAGDLALTAVSGGTGILPAGPETTGK